MSHIVHLLLESRMALQLGHVASVCGVDEPPFAIGYANKGLEIVTCQHCLQLAADHNYRPHPLPEDPAS